jgi:hypothetical protein
MANENKKSIRDRALHERQPQFQLEIERAAKVIDDILGDIYAPGQFVVLACALAEAIINHGSFPEMYAKAMCERLKLIALVEEQLEREHETAVKVTRETKP